MTKSPTASVLASGVKTTSTPRRRQAGDVDVFQSHAASPHHPEPRRLVQHVLIDARVCPHNQPIGFRKMSGQIGIIQGSFDHLGTFPQPRKRAGITAFGHNNGWTVRFGHGSPR
jgi:hypothetical protein